MEQRSSQALVEAYRAAFDKKDLIGCVGFYDGDAAIKFLFGTFKGLKAIEDWHRDRFAAEVQILQMEDMKVDGDTVTVHATVTSRKLKRFRMNEVKGTVVFHLRDGRFHEARFGPRRGVASHIDWHHR